MKFIDDFLNGITMYRLMLYCLIFLLIFAELLSLFNLLPFNFFNLLITVLILVAVCWITNKIFAKIFKVATNLESLYITALILALIITPIKNIWDVGFILVIAILAMSSKYILALKKKHIFNPVALSVFLSAVLLNYSASWWVGTALMIPAILIIGILVVRKIRRFDLVASFFSTSAILILGFNILAGNNLISTFPKIILDTPILFFAFVMLTEPQTTPPTKMLQIIYGSLVGILFVPQIHIGSFYTTPEMALLIGNIFSYIVSPKEKLILKLKQRLQTAPGTYDFIFRLDQKLNFSAGQYLEWTLKQTNPDSRGSRRYLTIASSPTEDDLRIGVKFYPRASSFKKTLALLNPGDLIVASQLSGEFILPKDINKKLVFMAGGIGITPFRSITKYLLDKNEKRDVILLYSNKLASDIVYKDIFKEALQKLGIKTIYILTDTTNIPKNWDGKTGFIDAKLIQDEIPDFKDRIFYISGPHSMVDAFEKTLKEMGLKGSQIKVDFFPGYA